MTLDMVLNFPDTLFRELTQAARDAGCHTRTFCEEAVEATLASRRLRRSRLFVAHPKGPQMAGSRRKVALAVPDARERETELVEHPVVSPLHASEPLA